MLATVKTKLDGVVSSALKRKVAAWWQGVGVDDVEWPEPDGADEANASPDANETSELQKAIKPGLPHYIKVCQMLWGEGYVTPGGSQFIDLWGQQLSLNKDKSTAFLGSALGGQARELHSSTGSWVAGFERHPELMEVADEGAMMAGLSKRVTSELYDPENISLEADRYDAIVAKEEFFRIDNKTGVLDAIAAGMKPKGLLLFTDYVATSPDMNAGAVSEMFGEMLGQPSLWTEEQYTSCLEKIGLDIHVNEELSDTYAQFINQAWVGYREFVAQINSNDESDLEKAALLQMVGQSAESWTRISMGLASGEIQLRRFLARKT